MGREAIFMPPCLFRVEYRRLNIHGRMSMIAPPVANMYLKRLSDEQLDDMFREVHWGGGGGGGQEKPKP
jgi:hypothetical protein